MRVLVLRPEGQAQASAARLRAADHEVIIAPVLAIEPTGTPPPPGPFAAILVTSANAAAALRSLGSAALPVFAVGSRTRAALAQAGFGEVATAPDGVSLAGLVIEQLAPARLLLAAGHDRKAEPTASLAKAGFEVVVWETYCAKSVDRLPEEARAALAGGQVDAVLHYSRRSAETALVLTRAAGLESSFAISAHLCLSDDVADGLAGLNGAEILAAAQSDEDALLALLDLFVARRIGGSLAPQS